MDEVMKAKEKELQRLEIEESIQDKKRSIAEKRALIADAKRRYGSDWKKILGGIKSAIKVNPETISTMYSVHGLKEYNDPKFFGRSRRR